MKIKKSEFKELIKEALREYLSTPPELYKIVYSAYFVDGDQQIEDNVISSNIQGKQRAQKMLNTEVKNLVSFLKYSGNTVKEPQSISDTETRIYYSDDQLDDYYADLQIVSQRPSLGIQEERIVDFLKNPFPWSEHNIPGKKHVLDSLYDTALQELGFFTTLNETEDTMLVYLVYDANFQEEAEPFSEYPAETERQFMDKLTQEYLDEFQRDSYVSSRAYINQIKKFINAQL